MTIINAERNSRELKEIIRMMKGLKSDTECNSVKEDRKIGID